MKKLIVILSLFVMLLSVGCTKNEESLPSEPTFPTEDESASAPTAPFEDETSYNIFTDERAFAVMIDNDGNSSRPHAGLEEAYLIYEAYVEGRATRLMALFKGTDTQKIGPVRSSRHYFLDYVFDNDALYSHAGYSPRALEELSSFGVNNLNGLVYEPKYYWRERKYKGDYHSMYTSIGNLCALSEKLGYRMTSETLPFKFSPKKISCTGDAATEITIPYADFYYVSYKFNEETGTYDRYINSSYHPTQSGAKLSAGQILFQFVKSYPLGDNSPRLEMDTVGSGSGILITNGIQTPLTWKKPSRTGQLKFYTEDGNELVLDSTKQTYVQIMPASLNYTIK